MAISEMWDSQADTAKMALRDIAVLHVLPDDIGQRKKAMGFCRGLFKLLETDSTRRLTTGTAGAILPNLKGCQTAVDLRKVIKTAFDWRSDSPNTYRPQVIATVPVALLCIKLDDGDPIVFQCEKEELGMLIRKLQATLKEM
jgi:hypothetical protein